MKSVETGKMIASQLGLTPDKVNSSCGWSIIAVMFGGFQGALNCRNSFFFQLIVTPIFDNFLIELPRRNFACSLRTFPRGVIQETKKNHIFYCDFLRF